MIGNETLVFWIYQLLIVSGFFVLSFIGHLLYWRWKSEYVETIEDWNVLFVFFTVLIFLPMMMGAVTGTMTQWYPGILYVIFGMLGMVFVYLGSVLARKMILPIDGGSV